MTRRRHQKLLTAMTPNGHLVHFVYRIGGHPICQSTTFGSCQVHARVTCPQCRKRFPAAAARRADRPHVVGLDWSPFYRAMRQALDGGAQKMPKVKVPFWPKLASVKP